MRESDFIKWMEQRPRPDLRKQEISALRRFVADPPSCYPPAVVADAEQQLKHLLAETN